MPDPFGYVRDWRRQFDESGWWHSFELPDGTRIDGVSSLAALRERLAQYPIPDNLAGKRVLDIGAWDGWLSFEMERRGAEVVAIDVWDNPRFRQMKTALDSRVDYRVLDVCDATPDRLGRFDIVLFLGVLYHLKHPLLGLERVCALSRGLAVVESFIVREEHRPGEQVESRPILEFYETDELGGETDNWFGPTLPCLMALCRTAGFARVEMRGYLPQGACVACYRHWEAVPDSPGPAPVLRDACDARNYGVNFRANADSYVTCWFDYDAASLTRDEVKPAVSGYGVRPVYVGRSGGDWQTNFRLPPGLEPGWHSVTVRVGSSAESHACRIAVDVPLVPEAIQISNAMRTDADTISLWVEGLPANADKANTAVELNGRGVRVTFVEPARGQPCRQVNVGAPAEMPERPISAVLRVAGAVSEAREIEMR